MSTVETLTTQDGKKVTVEKRGGKLSLRFSLRGQKRMGLSRFGVGDDITRALELANSLIRDIEERTTEEVEAIWFPTSAAAKDAKVKSYNIEDSYSTEMPSNEGGVYIVLSGTTGDCLYVGQSKCFNTRVNAATHPVLMYLTEENIPHTILYKVIEEERERLFEESRLIGSFTPSLQFGNVPEPYKSYRSGSKSKNERWDSQEILVALRKCSNPSKQLWCKQIAMMIYHQGKTVEECLSSLEGSVMSRSTFKRQLKRCGLSVYNIRR